MSCYNFDGLFGLIDKYVHFYHLENSWQKNDSDMEQAEFEVGMVAVYDRIPEVFREPIQKQVQEVIEKYDCDGLLPIIESK